MKRESMRSVRCDGFRPPGGECTAKVVVPYSKTGAPWGEILCADCERRLQDVRKKREGSSGKIQTNA